jgi:hypothetical protein
MGGYYYYITVFSVFYCIGPMTFPQELDCSLRSSLHNTTTIMYLLAKQTMSDRNAYRTSCKAFLVSTFLSNIE